MKTRGFEIARGYADQDIHLPHRKTARSAGYDIEAAADCVLLPHQVTVVPTGLKAYMQPDEYLGIHVRSGFSIKKQLSCINSQGIIDADYYGNADNDGHILVALVNHSDVPVQVGFALKEVDAERLLEFLANEQLNLFYLRLPVEIGVTGKVLADPPPNP